VDGRRAIWLVARRELRVRFASRTTRVITLVLLVIVVGLSVGVKLLANSRGSSVGFTTSAAALATPVQSLARATNQTVRVSTVDEATGEQQLRDGDLDALVTGTPQHFQVVVKQDLNTSLSGVFAVLARQITLDEQLVQAGADPAKVQAAVDASTVDIRSLEPPRTISTDRFVLSVIAGVLIYMALLMYGPAVAQGVVEEKSNRIVELLLATIRPWQLMLGKVCGIGLVGLVQLGLVTAVGVIVGLRTGALAFPGSIAATVAATAVIWFLLGYVIYALIFAALGALVSRQEEVTAVVTPATLLIAAPYVLGVTLLPSLPDSGPLAVLSMIPLFSPTLMPMRVALGVAPLWQVLVSIGLAIALIVGLVWLAGRIYGNAVLRTGSRVRLRDAMRAPSSGSVAQPH
jgi:ABC-2 type transport system permease protein